jgi:tetratricopeptide (TPR) repeat protein
MAVVGICREPFGESARLGWRVVTLEDSPRQGWVSVGAVTPFATRAKELKATAMSLRAVGSAKRSAQSFPELILTQKNPAIQQAWRELSLAISENETLPESERLPEPYFARAEVWASVTNYSDSLQDYLTAIKYARKSNRDLLSYSQYFDKLYDVAEKLQKVPVPAVGAESDPSFAAKDHYSRGNSSYFTGDLQEALDRFDSAVQLAPDQPLYWYFRALTHRRLGDQQRAQYDALMGAFFERECPPWQRRSLHGALTRVQGEMRTWLESYRLGSPTNRLLREYDQVAGS